MFYVHFPSYKKQKQNTGMIKMRYIDKITFIKFIIVASAECLMSDDVSDFSVLWVDNVNIVEPKDKIFLSFTASFFPFKIIDPDYQEYCITKQPYWLCYKSQ